MENSQSSQLITLVCSSNSTRLDKFLAKSIPKLSRSRAKQLIQAGLVQVDGLSVKASTVLQMGNKVVVNLNAVPTEQIVPQNIPIDILFEDEALLVLNKTAGLVVHPAAGHYQGTLTNALLYHNADLAKLPDNRMGLVHRLDKDTSGVMVVAKTETALQRLQAQFRARNVDKTYLALVCGSPQVAQASIDVPLGRDPQNRQKFAAVSTGKAARTHYKTLQTFRDYSLLEIALETGRTHQIRVHLAWLGYSVAGDTMYGRQKRPPLLPRQFLHASQLGFTHPESNKYLKFQAPLPADLQGFLDTL